MLNTLSIFKIFITVLSFKLAAVTEFLMAGYDDLMDKLFFPFELMGFRLPDALQSGVVVLVYLAATYRRSVSALLRKKRSSEQFTGEAQTAQPFMDFQMRNALPIFFAVGLTYSLLPNLVDLTSSIWFIPYFLLGWFSIFAYGGLFAIVLFEMGAGSYFIKQLFFSLLGCTFFILINGAFLTI